MCSATHSTVAGVVAVLSAMLGDADALKVQLEQRVGVSAALAADRERGERRERERGRERARPPLSVAS